MSGRMRLHKEATNIWRSVEIKVAVGGVVLPNADSVTDGEKKDAARGSKIILHIRYRWQKWQKMILHISYRWQKCRKMKLHITYRWQTLKDNDISHVLFQLHDSYQMYPQLASTDLLERNATSFGHWFPTFLHNARHHSPNDGCSVTFQIWIFNTAVRTSNPKS